MHRRQLVTLYVALTIISVLLIWRFTSEWKRASLRYVNPQRGTATTPIYVPPSPAQRPAPPVANIIAKNLFSPDRSNDVAQDEKPQPAPPAPIVFGTMNLGGSYEALMADGGQSARPGFRRVKIGDQLGAYTIIEIRDEKVVVEFRGQKTTLDVYESANSVPREAARTNVASGPVVVTAGTPQPPATAPAQPSSTPASSGASARPSQSSELIVTIEGNRRRVERPTPFGPQVWYEDIPK